VGEAIGQMLPTAVGITISPLPIVAVVLMLATARGRSNGLAFVLGWIVALSVVMTAVVAAAGDDATDDDGAPADWVTWLELVLGLLLLLLAARRWRGRPRGDGEAALPTWMAALETFTPPKAAGAGAVLAAANPKNLLLTLAGAAAIAQADLGAGEAAGAIGIFVAVATLGVAAPVVVAVATGDRAREILDDLRTWLARHDAAIMTALLLVIGAKLIGDAISGFAA
jgi:threonine/homoserine/homoserine lactone efflux protein